MAETAASPAPAIQIAPGDSKAEIRTKVWDFLVANRLASFPFPPHRRIPNFKGAEAAGDQVTKLDVFNLAKNVKVDPDRPLQQIRFRTLEAEKVLIVPTPRLRSGLFNVIKPPADGGVLALKTCATRQGVDEFSEPIGLDDQFHVDLIVVGCVTVSPNGWRIGKGSGFSDLEYAMMVSIGAVDSSVPVVTVVHDCQVLDLPESLFGPHDLPVDYIVTPTRIIQCDTASTKRPEGMIWSLLSAERMLRIPVLGRLRYREWKAGKDVRLSGETDLPTELTDAVPPENEEDEVDNRPRRVNRRRPARRLRSETEREADRSGETDLPTELTDSVPPENEEEEVDNRRRRANRRRPGRRQRPDTELDADRSGDDGRVNGVVNGTEEEPRLRVGRGRRRPRQHGRRVLENDRTSESEKDVSTDRNESEGHRNQSARGSGGRRARRGLGRRDGGSRKGPPRPVENGDAHDGIAAANAPNPRGGRRRRRRERVSESDGDASGGRRDANHQSAGGGHRGRRFLDDCEGSVYVGSLPRSARVSEFKAEVRDRDVQPLRVVWRGGLGFAFLNFRTLQDAEHALSALEGMHISDRSLRLEMAKSTGGFGRRRRPTSQSDGGGGGEDGPQSDEA